MLSDIEDLKGLAQDLHSECELLTQVIAHNSLFTPAVACTSTWFKRRRAVALGIVASGSSIGAVIYPIAIEKLIPQIGFGWTVRVVALIQLATLVISNIVMKSRLPPRKAGPLVEPKAFLQPSYTLFTIGSFLAFWGLYTPFFYSPSYAEKIHAPHNILPYILAMMNVFIRDDCTSDNRAPQCLGEYYPILLQT
jgi:nitrate/nitrite transporter NarK